MNSSVPQLPPFSATSLVRPSRAISAPSGIGSGSRSVCSRISPRAFHRRAKLPLGSPRRKRPSTCSNQDLTLGLGIRSPPTITVSKILQATPAAPSAKTSSSPRAKFARSPSSQASAAGPSPSAIGTWTARARAQCPSARREVVNASGRRHPEESQGPASSRPGGPRSAMPTPSAFEHSAKTSTHLQISQMPPSKRSGGPTLA